MQHPSESQAGIPAAVERRQPEPALEAAAVELDAASSSTGPAVGLPGVLRWHDPASALPGGDYAVETGTASVDGALRLAAALLGYGLPVFRVEEALGRLTSAMGVRVHSLGLPRALVVTVPGLVSDKTLFVPAEPGVVDLDRLSSLHALVGQVERGELSPEDVDEEVHRVLDAPPHYRSGVVVVGCALSGWGAACALGGGLWEAHAAGLLGFGVAALLWSASGASGRGGVALALPMLAGVLSGAFAVAASALHPLQPAVVISASLLPLLPGLSLTVAMMELGAGHSVCGTSRFAASMSVLLQLGFGALVGARMGGALQLPSALPTEQSLPPSLLWLGALSMTLGVAVLVQVRRRDLGWVLGISAVAFAASRLTSEPYGPAAGALISSLLVSVLSNLFARRFDRPASVLQVPGILMLVPGCLGLSSLSGLIGTDPVGALASAGQVMLIATGLSLGVLLSTTVLPARSSF